MIDNITPWQAIKHAFEQIMQSCGWIRRERHELVVYLLEAENAELLIQCAEQARNYAALQASIDEAGCALARMRQPT